MTVKWTARVGLAVVVLSLMAAFAFPASAQLTEATLKGVVTDTGGRVLAGSPINAKSENTGQSRTAVTDGSGGFLMPELPPGTYTISVAISGFKTFEQKGLQLNVGQTTNIDIQLQVGEVQEVVEVQADEAKVAVATDARLSDTIAQRQLTELPVAQRDVFGLIRLSAGATAIPGA